MLKGSINGNEDCILYLCPCQANNMCRGGAGRTTISMFGWLADRARAAIIYLSGVPAAFAADAIIPQLA